MVTALLPLALVGQLTTSTALAERPFGEDDSPNRQMRLDVTALAPWSVGLYAGSSMMVGGAASEWGPGPAAGLVLARSLTHDISVRGLISLSGHPLTDDANVWVLDSGESLSPDAYAGTLLHQWHGISLEWGPRARGELRPLYATLFFRGGAGLDVYRSHLDMPGAEGITRISATGVSPGVTGGTGIEISLYGAGSMHIGVDFKGLFSFDRGERGGGDNLRGFLSVTPSADLLARF